MNVPFMISDCKCMNITFSLQIRFGPFCNLLSFNGTQNRVPVLGTLSYDVKIAVAVSFFPCRPLSLFLFGRQLAHQGQPSQLPYLVQRPAGISMDHVG